MQDDLKHNVVNFIERSFFISTNIIEHDGYSWWLTAVYGLSIEKIKRYLREELNNLSLSCCSNWLLGGDFNVVRWRSEISFINPAKFSMNKFNYLIHNLNIIVPPLINGFFTWSNMRDVPVLSRLDRFLYSSGWEQRFSSHHCKLLTRITLDHFPIIFESPSLTWGPASFRLNDVWNKEECFQRVITRWWTESMKDGYPGYSSMKRLKQLAKNIKSRQFERTCAKDQDIMLQRSKIDKIDSMESQNILSKEDYDRRTALKIDLLDATIKKAEYQAQRAKRLWLN